MGVADTVYAITGSAAVASGFGGWVGARFTAARRVRAEDREERKEIKGALVGTPKTEFHEAEPGLIDAVSALTSQVHENYRELDVRLRVVEGRKSP